MNKITKRRLNNFKSNKRGYFSFIFFMFLFFFTLFAEFIANDKPIIVKYDGIELYNATVPRTSTTIFKSIREYGDPESVYYGEIPISLDDITK